MRCSLFRESLQELTSRLRLQIDPLYGEVPVKVCDSSCPSGPYIPLNADRLQFATGRLAGGQISRSEVLVGVAGAECIAALPGEAEQLGLAASAACGS